MVEILVLVGVIALILIVAWVLLRPKSQKSVKKKTKKSERPGEKRASNVPNNKDPKIEGIGKAVIRSSDRRRRR